VAAAMQAVVQQCRVMVEPAVQYFNSRVFVKLAKDVELYKRLRYCNPYVVRRLATGGGGVDEDAVVTAFNALGRLDAADIPGSLSDSIQEPEHTYIHIHHTHIHIHRAHTHTSIPLILVPVRSLLQQHVQRRD
jgi:hypothetical protein